MNRKKYDSKLSPSQKPTSHQLLRKEESKYKGSMTILLFCSYMELKLNYMENSLNSTYLFKREMLSSSERVHPASFPKSAANGVSHTLPVAPGAKYVEVENI